MKFETAKNYKTILPGSFGKHIKMTILRRTAKTAVISIMGTEKNVRIDADKTGEIIRPFDYVMTPVFFAAVGGAK